NYIVRWLNYKNILHNHRFVCEFRSVVHCPVSLSVLEKHHYVRLVVHILTTHISRFLAPKGFHVATLISNPPFSPPPDIQPLRFWYPFAFHYYYLLRLTLLPVHQSDSRELKHQMVCPAQNTYLYLCHSRATHALKLACTGCILSCQ